MSVLSTSVFGYFSRTSFRVMTCSGKIESFSPVYAPTTASVRTCDHSDSVAVSYIRRLDSNNSPLTPKLSVAPPTRRSNTIPESQSGQKVTAIGVSPIVSFTISCQTRILYG